MPIAYFLTSINRLNKEQLDTIVVEWSERIKVNVKDITITVTETKIQAGNKYKIIVNLYLPSLWDGENISHIQISLAQLLTKHMNLKSDDMLIMTSIIQSGNVIENGKTIKW